MNLYPSQVSSDSLLYDRENDRGPLLSNFFSVVTLLGLGLNDTKDCGIHHKPAELICLTGEKSGFSETWCL